ncbi:MAG: threonine synthase [Thermofilum sp.]|jgi:threonine synthase|uniref:threonine synthase n=1 Tax=Thermofilum sp. TaxID=1961369 RepID=UPI00258B22DE|nr:threonine synthase [Thermofilum sp.]MCI4407845.1 threonine synthase [Thermofilum sp.]
MSNPRLFKEEVKLRCIHCGYTMDADPWTFTCPRCGSLLEVEMPTNIKFSWDVARKRRFGVWRYRELLPIGDNIEPVTMHEGGTPLLRLRSVENGNAYLKFEGTNPTGSFKDRGMSFGVTIAKHLGVRGVIVASTGNTAASAAAYSARAGLECIVVLPKGKVAKGKLAQALLHGAHVTEIEGVFDQALERVFVEAVLRGHKDLYPLNSYNPWRLEGQKTLAFEIVDEIGVSPDVVIVPVGNAGNISAIWKGFKEMYTYGLVKRLPRMIGVQAEGAAPLVKTWQAKSSELIAVENPSTVASAIRIGKPVNWLKAMKAVEDSKGVFIAVSDKEILEAMRYLAINEGIGVEPASAASLAGYWKALEEGIVSRDELSVLIATGHALKDPDTIINRFS